MPPRKQSKSKAASTDISVKELTHQEKIVTLHGLLRETEASARRVNQPLADALFIILSNLLHDSVDSLVPLITNHKDALEFLIKTLQSIKILQMDDEGAVPLYALPLYLVAVSPLLYLSYKTYQVVSSKLLDVFPNGFTFKREPHRAYAAQKKLIPEDEVGELITEVRKLTAQQKVSHRRWFAARVATGLVFPHQTPVRYIFDLKLQILVGTAGLWSNWNTPKQLQKYVQHLNVLTFRDAGGLETTKDKSKSTSAGKKCSWKIVKGTEKSKNTAVFSLNISSEESLRIPHVGVIPTSSYTYDLYRTFLATNIPVFIAREGEIYVGFRELNPSLFGCRRNKTMITMQRRLGESAHQSVLHTQYAELNVKGLNKLSALLKVKSKNVEEWDFYRCPNEHGELETYYYTGVHHVPKTFREEYRRALATFISPENVIIEGDILTISRVPEREINFNEIENQLRERIERLQVPLPGSLSSVYTLTSSTGKIPRKRLPEIEEEKEVKNEAKETPYPTSIIFSGGVRFQLGENKHSPERAYPLHVPWLPEGRAYISIDARVIQQTEKFVPAKQVLDRLDRGVVIGASKTNKDKAGNVGLQSTDEPYQTLDGINVPRAFLKVKVDNYGFFARHVGTVITRDEKGNEQPRLHYRIDGVGLRH